MKVIKYTHFKNILLFLFVFTIPAVASVNDSLNFITKSNFSLTPVAVVGAIKIYPKEFINGFDYGPAFIRKMENPRLAYLKYMINERLLALYGLEIRVDTLAQVKETFNAFSNDLMTEKMFREEILPKVKLSENEVDTVINQKLLHLKIKWIFYRNNSEKKFIYSKLNNKEYFDSIFSEQFKSGFKRDERELGITRYHLGQRNPELAKIIDTLTIGKVSKPFYKNGGWYIFKLEKAWKDLIVSEGQYNRLKSEAITAVKKRKIDILSDLYVKKIMENNSPIIKRIPLNITTAFIADFMLSRKKYKDWKVSSFLKKAVRKSGIQSPPPANRLHLIQYKSGYISIRQFLIWFRTRIEYIKLDKTNFDTFYASVEQLVWRMTRDTFLTLDAERKGYDKNPEVLEQKKWWWDKILYSAARNSLSEAVILKLNENNLINADTSKPTKEKINYQLGVKIFRTLQQMKTKYPVVINYKLLNSLKLFDEKDKKAVDFYTVKKGGLIPRTPYPTIDFEWKNWE